MKKLSIYFVLCVLGLWMSPAVARPRCAKSAVFAKMRSPVHLQMHQSEAIGGYSAGVGACHFGSFVEKLNRVTASGSSSPESLVSYDWRNYSDEAADMGRKGEGEDGIPYGAASEAAVRSNSRGCNKYTSRVISKSSSRLAGWILQNPLIESHSSPTHRRIFSGVFPRPFYALL